MKTRIPQAVAGLELRAHVTLGKATVPLKEIFRLTVGSVIELGQLVTEPAELVVNGTVVARGQIVVMNGNYGLKVATKTAQKSGAVV